MTAYRRFRALPVIIIAPLIMSADVSVSAARATPLPEGATASGGVVLPEIARQALSQVSTSGTSHRYTREWTLFPASGFGRTSR